MTNTVFMPGARPGDQGKLSIGAMHYPAWLAAELSKGREFEVVKLFFQTEHKCLLDGTAVEFRANLTYDVPQELVKIFTSERQGALPIAVLMEHGARPRRLKDESKIIVKVKMLSTRESAFPDGIRILKYEKDKEYSLPKPLADGFLRQGWAEEKK
jgi:hypothetical protein